MLDPKTIADWYVDKCATMYDVSIKFDVPIEEAYKLVKAGLELAT